MKSFFCLALILFGTIGVFAQERTISKAEFDAVNKNALWAPTAWKGKSYRFVQTSEAKSEGKTQTAASGKVIIEFASLTESYLISEVKSGSKITKSESIRIGDKTYKRKGDEAWVEGTVEAKSSPKTAEANASASTATSTDNTQSDSQIEYKYIGTEKLNDLNAEVYLVIQKIKRIDSATGKESLSTITQKYWFGEDGIKLKQDTVNEMRGSDISHYTRLTFNWELDPNIRIEAPKMK